MIEIRQGLPRCAGPTHCLCVDTKSRHEATGQVPPRVNIPVASLGCFPWWCVSRHSTHATRTHAAPQDFARFKRLYRACVWTQQVGRMRVWWQSPPQNRSPSPGHRVLLTQHSGYRARHSRRDAGSHRYPEGINTHLQLFPRTPRAKGVPWSYSLSWGHRHHHKHTDGAQRLVCACPFLRAG